MGHELAVFLFKTTKICFEDIAILGLSIEMIQLTCLMICCIESLGLQPPVTGPAVLLVLNVGGNAMCGEVLMRQERGGLC